MRKSPGLWIGHTAAAAIVAIALSAVACSPLSSAPATPLVSASPNVSIAVSPASASAAATRYASDYLPWAIDLPPGWSATTAEGDAAGSYEQFAKHKPTLVTSGVGSTEPPSGTTPEDYVQEAIDKELELMRSECDIEPIESTETTMGGEPAYELVYECNGRGVALIVTSHDNRRYAFLFEAADLQPVREAIDELLPAFEFTD